MIGPSSWTPFWTQREWITFHLFLTEICPVRNTRSSYHRQSTPDRQDYCIIMKTHKEGRKERTRGSPKYPVGERSEGGNWEATVSWTWISRALPFLPGTPLGSSTELYGATAPVINNHHDYYFVMPRRFPKAS